MISIGVFREGEIDGKPFRIFNFLSQKDNPSSSSSGEAAINSGDDDIPLFICQSFRYSDQWKAARRSIDTNREDFLPMDFYPFPHLFNKKSGDEQFKFLIGSDIYDHPCKLPLVPLLSSDDKDYCSFCESETIRTNYYLCVTCGYKYHRECIEFPLEIKHPSYSFLSLKLYYLPLSSYLLCFCCQEPINGMLYYCPTYKLMLDTICAMKPIPILIDHQKRHPHTLTYFPKQNSLPCHVCGLIRVFIPTYICARCVFVVHQDCVYHPYVIKISRHHHRISFTYSLPSGKLFCGVCRRKVDNDYGAYSCNKCDDYFVHTKCALREDLWDGKELEGIPEELEIIVDPFERISDGIILHFSHDHHLKLEISRFYDETKLCRACNVPIYEGNLYSCMDQCDFILHETCANAPRRKHHPLHAHPLTLKVVNIIDDYGYIHCYACQRDSCGFVYVDHCGFRLDLQCASVSEPFQYEGHKHPLFLALTPEEEESALCQICQEEGDEDNDCKKLTCIDCKFIICFACATLPYKARYKHDKHFLTFRGKEKESDHQGWCEVCEKKIDYSRKGGYYSCDDYCSTTLHVDCLLGKDPYMKPDQNVVLSYNEFLILRNSTMTRSFCHGSNHRCPHNVVFKTENMTFCSMKCWWFHNS